MRTEKKKRAHRAGNIVLKGFVYCATKCGAGSAMIIKYCRPDDPGAVLPASFARKVAHQLGWRIDRKRGWLCPKCWKAAR